MGERCICVTNAVHMNDMNILLFSVLENSYARDSFWGNESMRSALKLLRDLLKFWKLIPRNLHEIMHAKVWFIVSKNSQATHL